MNKSAFIMSLILDLSEIVHPHVTVVLKFEWECVGSSVLLCLVTLKMVSRLCVSLCEAGVESFLFICPSVCSQHIRSCIGLDLIPSAHISPQQHGGQ